MAGKSKYELKLTGVIEAAKEVEELADKLDSLESQLKQTDQGSIAFERLTNEIKLANIQSEKAVKNLNDLNNQKMTGLKNTLASVGSGFKSVAATATGAGSGVDYLTKATQALGIESDLLNSIIEKFGGIAEGSFGKAGGAATTFGRVTKIAMASTGIGLLLVALTSLVAYFTKSTQGAEKLSKATAYLSGLFTGIVNVLSDVGESIVDAFSDKNQSILDKVVEKTKNIWQNLDQARQGNWVPLITSLQAVGKAVDKVGDSIDKALNINGMEKQLKKDKLAASALQQQLENTISTNQGIAASDLKTQAQRDAAAKRVAQASKELLNSKTQILRKELELLQAQNSQVAGGKKSVEMLQAEQDLKNEIAANEAEKGNLNLELQEQLYTSAKEKADLDKDSFEKAREENKQKLRLQLEEATTQEEKLAILQAIYDEELKFNEAAKASYMQLGNTSDRAAALLEIETARIAAEDELRSEVKATNEEYSKRFDDATAKIGVAEVEAYKLKAVQAGLDKQYELQKFYVDKGYAAEEQALTDAFEKEKTEGKKTEEELLALKLEFDNKKEALHQTHVANIKAIDDKRISDEEADREKKKAAQEKADAEELAAFEKKYQDMAYIAEAFAQNVAAVTDAFTQATLAAFDAKIEEVQTMLDLYKDRMSVIGTEISDTEARINDLESKLVSAKGAERARLLQQLDQERAKEKALAQDRKAEDTRIQKAELEKIELEKKKEKAIARQEIVMQSLTIAQHALNAAKAVEAMLEITEKGKFGWDNLALLAASTAGIIGAMASIKSAAKKGFKDGGFTSESISDSTEVGVVHANEYVLPAWMVRENPVLVSQLESVRTKGGYNTGGMVAANMATPSATDIAMLNQMQALNANLHAYSQTPIQVVATEVADVNARVAKIKEHAIK